MLIDLIEEEMHLVYMERMNFMGPTNDAPMMIPARPNTRHGRIVGTEPFAVDIEALLVLCEGDSEIRRLFFECRERLGRAHDHWRRGDDAVAVRGCFRLDVDKVGQHH